MDRRGRTVFVADSILLSGRVVGLDEINHFIREGLSNWRAVSGRGEDIAEVLRRELDPALGGWRWTEYGLKGMSLTGALGVGTNYRCTRFSVTDV